MDRISHTLNRLLFRTLKLTEQLEDPRFDEMLSLAEDYRGGNKKAGEKFTRRLRSRTQDYLIKLITHGRDTRPESLTALRNCLSNALDENITMEEMMKYVDSQDRST
jgi:hypothetical protein